MNGLWYSIDMVAYIMVLHSVYITVWHSGLYHGMSDLYYGMSEYYLII